MGRRSATNPRYQKHTGPAGSTRKSASSAKLKRSGETKPSGKKRKSERPRLGLVPQTPEMKRWRRIWWVLIGVALLFASTVVIPGVRDNRILTQVALAFEFIALGVAIWIDWKKIRPLRQQAVEQAKRERKEK